MTVSNLSTDESFSFDALTNISAKINILLRRLADQKNKTKKEEDDDLKIKLEDKYNADEYPDFQNEPIIIADKLNVEPENVEEKARRADEVVEPTLETPQQIEISDQNRTDNQKWLDDFLRGLDPPNEQELNDRVIAQVLCEEIDVPVMDGKIDDIFIDDNEQFDNDDMIEADKEYICALIDKTKFNENDVDFKVADEVPNSDDDILYVKYIPLPPDSPVEPLHPRERLNQKVIKN